MEVISTKSKETADAIAKISFKNDYTPRAFDIWALGITIVIGGQYFSFNFGYECGFGSFAICTFLMGSAYTCLLLCTSEMASALPFAGGAYGLARCTLGFYPGYLVGCCECVEYIIYVSVTAMVIGSMLTEFFQTPETYQPLWWLLFYVTALPIQIWGGKVFWRFNYVMAIISILVLLIYVFGSMAFVDFNKFAPLFDRNATSTELFSDSSIQLTNSTEPYTEQYKVTSSDYFVGGGETFMRCFPLAAWFYVGVESLAFACDLVEEPKTSMPLGNMSCVLTLFTTSILVLFVCASLEPGLDYTSTTLFPFNAGFMKIFNWDEGSEVYAIALAFPATYATAFGFIFSYGKLLMALSNSKLIPAVFGIVTDSKTSSHPVPYVALILGSVMGYLICILVFFFPDIALYLFNICMLSGFFAYMSQCYGYIALQFKFQNIKREFKSPLGIFGAAWAFCVFLLGAIGVIAFQGDDQVAVISFVCLAFLLSLYYFLVSQYTQTFSPDEQKIMFVAHVINFNQGGKRRKVGNSKKKGNKVQPEETSTGHISNGINLLCQFITCGIVSHAIAPDEDASTSSHPIQQSGHMSSARHESSGHDGGSSSFIPTTEISQAETTKTTKNTKTKV